MSLIQVDENVKSLSREVLDQVREESERMLADARAKADEIRQRAREQAQSERSAYLAQAAIAAERARSQTIAVTQLSSRTAAFGQREKLLTGVFAAARDGLERIPKDENYSQVVERLLREALTQLGAASASVQADEAARKILMAGLLEKISLELNIALKLGEPLKQGAGVLVETDDGRMKVDNTLDTRLKRLQDTLRSAVYHILMGESL